MEDDEERTGETHIRTSFLDNQAQEISKPPPNMPLRIVGGLILCGVLIGLFQMVMYFVNLSKTTAVKNVATVLQNPILRDGTAMVDVDVDNLNPEPVSNVTMHWDILGPSGSPVASGTVSIPGSVPAGDTRLFRNVKLGPLTEQAQRMHAEAVDLKLGPKPALKADLANTFSDAAALKDEDKITAFQQFIKDAPDFVPAYVELARAYMSTHDYDKAASAMRTAIKLNPKDGNLHFHLALALQSNNEKKESIAELKKAYDLLPEDENIQRMIQNFNE